MESELCSKDKKQKNKSKNIDLSAKPTFVAVNRLNSWIHPYFTKDLNYVQIKLCIAKSFA
jgi:hypothetical protein